MRKISAMYQWSGGTDPKHSCGECKNCAFIQRGKREVRKCLSYGSTDDPYTDWNPAYIACKAFDKKPPKKPILFSGGEDEKPAAKAAPEVTEKKVEKPQKAKEPEKAKKPVTKKDAEKPQRGKQKTTLEKKTGKPQKSHTRKIVAEKEPKAVQMSIFDFMPAG